MENELTKEISDINNLTYILLEFIKNTEQSEDINVITSLVSCINEKLENLYLKINKFI